MIKVRFHYKAIDGKRLEQEMKNAGFIVQYAMGSEEKEGYIDVYKFDDNFKMEEVDDITVYKERTYETIVEIDEEGNEVSHDIEVWNEFDITSLIASIQSIIDAHDPTPNLEKLYQDKVKALIREQYTIEDEIGLTNDCNLVMMAGEVIPADYTNYRTFVESCKDAAYLEVYGYERT